MNTTKQSQSQGGVKGVMNDPGQISSKGVAATLKLIVLWALCALFLLMTVGCILVAVKPTDYVAAISSFLLAILICPGITERLREVPSLAVVYRFQVLICIVLFIVFYITIAMIG